MQFEQTVELCKRVALVEGRTYTAELARAWHELLKGLEVEVADRAGTLAMQDHNIHQVGPKHVLSKVPSAVAELNALIRKEHGDEAEWKSEPEPICELHDLRITQCKDCIDLLVHHAGHLYGDALHEWAKQHVYRADSLVKNGAA